MYLSEEIQKKWSPVLEHPDLGVIKDSYRKAVTAIILENQEKALREEKGIINEAVNANNMSGAVDTYDPILISLVRRALPNLMAYDVCGVQPMTGPTGLIFAMKSKYRTTKGGATDGDEALFGEALTPFSGDSAVTQTGGPSGLGGLSDTNADSTIDDQRTGPTAGGGITTPAAEALGNTGTEFAEMGFSIEKASVEAKSRALKAEYTIELAQDLKAIHGLDAEAELANILSTEILAEINREVIRTINSQAKIGCLTSNCAVPGVFDLSTDADLSLIHI